MTNTRLLDVFGVDVRSLALFRILLACVVLLDVIGRSRYLVAHYSDDGVLPRRDLLLTLNSWRWSVNLISGEPGIQRILFAATIGCAVAMLVGYRTRVATILVWILVISIQVRNPALSSGADTLLRLLLFWSMFLPLGERWSLDARSASRNEATSRRTTHVLSIATVAILLQVVFMYWFTAILKDSPQWRSDGTALYYALGAKDITTGFGNFLSQFPDLLKVLTFSSLGVEILAPALLFVPWKTGPIRTVAAFMLMAFHFGIWLTMNVGIFPWASAFCMTCFFPAWFWDVLLPKVMRWGSLVRQRFGAVIPQGGRMGQPVAELVQRVVQRPAQRPAQRLNSLFSPLRMVTGGSSDGRLVSAKLGNVGPSEAKPDADGGVRGGEGTSARSDRAVRQQGPRRWVAGSNPLVNVICAALITYVFFWNVSTVSSFQMPSSLKPMGYSLGLYQTWSMFAPRPQQATLWYVVEGTLADGQSVDLLTPIVENDMSIVQAPVWDQSKGVQHDDKYWRKYLAAIKGNDNEQVRFAAYACREWNKAHDGDSALTRVQLFAYSARTLPDNKQGEPQQSLMGSYRCI